MNGPNRLLPIIAGAIAGGAIALAVAGGTTKNNNTTTTVVQPSSGRAIPTSFSSSGGQTINQIYRQASPGVVDIVVTSQGGSDASPFGGSQQQQGEGAGVVYDSKGDILTDEHVVAGATNVRVKFPDGKTVGAKVLGTDPSTDVGVIKVDPSSVNLHPIPFTDSSKAQVGDRVLTIGSPFSLPGTTTQGIVSSVGRSIQAPNQYTITGAIQTDAAINPGNSGGPLLDADGRVLGLVDQINTNTGQSAGVGFAVPSSTVQRIAGEIIGGQKVQHSYVGVELNGNSSGGAQVSQVQPNSPAVQAGLEPGDLITAIDGKGISSTAAFISTVDGFPPGKTIKLNVKRGGSSKQIQLKLGTRPAGTPNNG